MKNVKNINSYLVAISCCIVLLLLMCYFGINSSMKGTSASMNFTCPAGKHLVGDNGYCCPTASDIIKEHEGKLYCITPGNFDTDIINFWVNDSGELVCKVYSIPTNGNSDTVCQTQLGSNWVKSGIPVTNNDGEEIISCTSKCYTEVVESTLDRSDYTYTINYELNGGSSGANAPTSAKYNEVVTIDNPTKTAIIYFHANNMGVLINNASAENKRVEQKITFGGWKSDDVSFGDAKYALPSGSSWNIWNDGTVVSANYTSFKNLRIDNGSSVKLSAMWNETTLRFPSVYKSGYNCWWEKESSDGTRYEGLDVFDISKFGEKHFYANCEIKENTVVIFSSNGYTLDGTSLSTMFDNNATSVTVECDFATNNIDGECYIEPPKYKVPNGYILYGFGGMVDDNDASNKCVATNLRLIENGKVSTGGGQTEYKLTYYPCWKKIDNNNPGYEIPGGGFVSTRWTANYHDDSGSVIFTDYCDTTVSSNNVCRVDVPTNSPVKEGYTLVGWRREDASCSNPDDVYNGSTVPIAGNRELYPCWKELDEPNNNEEVKPSSSINASGNPQTGNIATFIVLVIALISIIYSLWYFRKMKQN